MYCNINNPGCRGTLNAKFHLAKCSGSWVIVRTSFLSYLAIVKKSKIRSCDFDLWHMILKFPRFERLSRYMFTQNVIHLSAAVYELSRSQRTKTPTKTMLSVVTADSNKAIKYYFIADKSEPKTLCVRMEDVFANRPQCACCPSVCLSSAHNIAKERGEPKFMKRLPWATVCEPVCTGPTNIF